MTHSRSLTDSELRRYARHVVLPEIDCAGQVRLLGSRALVVGLGGLGSPAALYLAASGVGSLIICDDDAVDLSNLQRQVLYDTAHIGRKKTECAAERLNQFNPQLEVTTIDKRLAYTETREVMDNVDIVIDCSDNFATRFTLNALSIELHKPLVMGAAVGFTGQVMLVAPNLGYSPCLRCLYPEETEGDTPQLSCSENGIFAPLVGVVGALQASIAVNTLLGNANRLAGKLTLINLAEGMMRQVTATRDPNCPVCNPI